MSFSTLRAPRLHRRATPFGSAAVAALLVLGGAVGCRSRGASEQGNARATSAPSVGPKAAGGPSSAERCHAVTKDPVLSLGDAPKGRAAPAGDEEGDPSDPTAPFAPHLGDAIPLAAHFAVAGQRPAGGGTEDVVALVGHDGRGGRVVSLGRVYGDVGPATLAARGDELVMAVPDADAKGGTLKLRALSAVGESPRSLGEITEVEHDAGVALAFGPAGALVVWGAERAGRTSLRAASFDPSKTPTAMTSGEVEGTFDAEAPVLAVRPGGFWLAWIAERAAPDAGPPAEDQKLVAVGPRVLHAMPLDPAGKPSGRPLSVSGEAAHVVGFDAIGQADGALDLAFREDDTTPGVDRGDVQLARVLLDGSVKVGRVDGDDFGGGVPALLADPSVPGRTWLSARSAGDAARLGVLASSGVAAEGLASDPALGSADVLAAGAGRLLVSRYRERALELSLVACRP